MSKINLYTTKNCPKCKVLGDMLDSKKIQYEKICDVDLMVKKGFLSAPVLEISMNHAEAYNWVLEQGECE